MYHVPLALQCIYARRYVGGEDEDGEEWGEIPGGWEIVKIAWPLVCR